MTLRRTVLSLAAIATVLTALPAFAGAANAPVFYRYAKCKSALVCTFNVYTDSASTKIVTFQAGPKCKSKGASLQANNLTDIKLDGKHKFAATMPASSYNKGDLGGTQGTMTISGKVTKKAKIKGKYSVDAVASGCANVKTGKFTLKYKGKLTGG